MIDQGVFKVEWALLCEKHSKSFSKAMTVRYYQALSRQMDTEGFRVAAAKMFERAGYFPSVEEFVAAAAGSTDEQALEQWQLCDRIMRGQDVLDRMTEAGRKTVALMGGPVRLRQTPIDEVHFRRAEFIRLFGDATEIYRREKRPELPPWTDRDTERLREVAPNLRLLGGDTEGVGGG